MAAADAAAWVDLAVSLTPKTLQFYQRLLQHSILSLRIPAAAIMKTFVAKGTKEPSEKLQVLKVLNIVSLLDRHEVQTRGATGDPDIVDFRAALGSLLAVYGAELVSFVEDVSALTPILLSFRW